MLTADPGRGPVPALCHGPFAAGDVLIADQDFLHSPESICSHPHKVQGLCHFSALPLQVQFYYVLASWSLLSSDWLVKSVPCEVIAIRMDPLLAFS